MGGTVQRRPSTAVVVVSFNTKDLLGRSLRSVGEQLADGDELIVVDNASTDGSAAMVAEEFPGVLLIESGANLGFGRACNLGVGRTTADRIVLFNPDAVARPGMLDALHEAAGRHPGARIYGGRSLHTDGTVDPRSAWAAPTVWSCLCFAAGMSTLFKGSRLFDPESIGGWDRDSERHVDMVSGSLMMIERSLWDELGGFDERYFMYGEDLDLCLRAARLGARPLVVPDATYEHEVGAASTRADKRVMLLRGKIAAIRDNNSAWRGGAMAALISLGAALRGLVPRFGDGSWRAAWKRRDEWRSGYAAARRLGGKAAHR